MFTDYNEPSDYDKEQQRKQELKEMREEMNRTFELCSKAPNDLFPEFLFNPVINEFEDDNYIERGIVKDDDLSQSVRMLRRKYSNYFDYLDAMNIYNEYMANLVEKYGSKKIAKSGIKQGLFDDFLPPEPKLKNKKENRILLKTGINLSRKDPDIETDLDDIREIADKLFPVDISNVADEDFEMSNIPKDLRKAINEEVVSQKKKERRRNIYHSYYASNTVDAIIDYMNNKTSSKYDRHGRHKDTDSLSAIIKEMHQYDDINPDLIEILERASTVSVLNGRLVKAETEDELKIYEEFYKNGFDIMGLANKNIGKKGVRMLKQRTAVYGIDQALTKKERKKLKKKQKKEYKRNQKKLEADSRMRDVLLKNKVSFTRDGGEMNFRLRDIYGDD